MKRYVTWGIITLAALLMALALLYTGKRKWWFHHEEELKAIPAPELMFGLPVDSFRIIEGVVMPNQNLGEILGKYGVPMSKIDQLVKNSEAIFDVRKIRSGQNYYLFQKPDSTHRPCFLVYENSLIEYVVFNLSDTLCISKGKKKVRIVHKTASGTIKTSLWNTMTDNQLNPVLALDLSDIYAWTIDFFGIQKGDRFRIVYDEQFVDSVSVGIGPIHAVEFEHAGKSYYAFRFRQEEKSDYFDEKGESLRKAFLKAPLEYRRISSHFSGSRLHPILKIRRPHWGVDYAAPKGTPVVSIGDGTVVQRGYQGGAGNFVKITHNSVYSTMYLHLSGFARGLTVGSRVKQGEVIGYVGSTGLSTGPHLDFRVFKNGSPVDPLKIDVPPGDPVKGEFRPDFTHIKDSLTISLYKINWHEKLN